MLQWLAYEKGHHRSAESAPVIAAVRNVVIKQNVTGCAFCGKEFPRDTVTDAQLVEHISLCPKHPMALTMAHLAMHERLAPLWEKLLNKAKDIAAWSSDGLMANVNAIKEIVKEIEKARKP